MSLQVKHRTGTVITFGTFDLLHIGHLNILSRASHYGQRLVVGVSSDQLNFNKKAVLPTINQSDRMALVAALRCVNEVFLEESLELKADYIVRYRADVLVMGDDWAGRFDYLTSLCHIVYLPRTDGVSSSLIRSLLASLTTESIPNLRDNRVAG